MKVQCLLKYSQLISHVLHNLQFLLDNVLRQHPETTVRSQDQIVCFNVLQSFSDPLLHLVLALHLGPGHGHRAQDHLGLLEHGQQTEVIPGLCILNTNLVKPETVNLGSEQLIVGLRS